jgi:bacteriorhodopsin
MEGLVKNSADISLKVQIVACILTFLGSTSKVQSKDKVLTELLTLETIVQVIEIVFYVWITSSMMVAEKVTPRRYIDWAVTTPTMLFTTIVYLDYIHKKEKGKDTTMKIKDFYNQHQDEIKQMFIYNWLMLLFGFLGEIGILPLYISVSVGFIFFYLSFKIIHKYANKTEKGKNFGKLFTILWGLYGVAAILPLNEKNISYNILDIFSKNFYGIYLLFELQKVRQ